MAEDLQTNLTNYKLQLQQVEAALTSDPENDDLNKLKKDLQEVIDLTEDLLTQTSVVPEQKEAEPEAEEDDEDDSIAIAKAFARAHTIHDAGATTRPDHGWKIGDPCMAQYGDDHQHYPAIIDEILEDGSCTVTFEGWGNTEVTQASLLKTVEEFKKRSRDGEDAGPSSNKPMNKKDKMAAEREYKRKKAQKKAQRLKNLEEEREGEKNKWKDFNSKTFSKTNKGKVKKSIFATPDAVGGRVGVGTCGHSGQPMTKYKHQEKWKAKSKTSEKQTYF